MDNSKIKILGKEIILTPLALKGWTLLEGLKNELDEAISTKDFDRYSKCTVRFIEMASLSLPKIEWNKVPWYEVVSAYSEVIKLNTPTIEFPILSGSPEEPQKKQPWEYPNRSWYFWLNLFASNYGWSEEKIAELELNTAIGLYQEITVDDQLNKEWMWGLSEIAYPYNASTKEQKYKPLDRPNWMKPIIPKQLPVVRMRRDHLPVGNVIDIEEEEKKRHELRKAKKGI